MTDPPTGAPFSEEEQFSGMADRLSEARPVPTAEFRRNLGSAVRAEARRRRARPRPQGLWLIAAALIVVGSVVLALAAAQI